MYIYIHIHIQTHTIQLDITRYVESLHGLEVCVGELKKVEDLTHGMPGLGVSWRQILQLAAVRRGAN